MRRGLWLVVAAQCVFALAFAFDVAPLVDLWPFGGRGPLTSIFIGSIFAAAAASTAWCLLTGSVRALGGIALDYTVILAPLGLYALWRSLGGDDSSAHLVVFGLVALAGAGMGVALLRTSLRAQWRDERPAPRLVLVSFAVFIALLLVVSGSLLLRVQVLPWPVTDDVSTAIGLMFLGAAAYFAYGLRERRWENAGGQLAGFLAYDAVLIVPFLKRLPDVPAEFRVELIVYTAVVVYSGLLALWYLALDPRTRGRTAAVDAPAHVAA